MIKLHKLMDVLSAPSYEASYASAKATCSCILCGNSAKVFRDASARLEYNISCLCQDCQDEYLTTS
jgi:hypothetical protein